MTDAWDRLSIRARGAAVYWGGIGLLTWDVGRNARLPRRDLRLVLAQFDSMGVQSLIVATLAALFNGMVFALQAGAYLARFGADLYIGPIVALPILRELGPVVTAIMIGGKVASGITAEIGSMKVTEQIDALRAIGVNYVQRLVVPRVWAAFFVFPLLTVVADFVGLVGGMFIALFERHLDPYFYWNTIFYWVVLRDLFMGIGKSFFFGVIVTLIGTHNGLVMTGGTEGLGRATTATVVQTSLAVIVADFFLTKLFLLM